MQNGTAAHAALRTFRRFSAVSGLSRHSQSSFTDGGLRPILHIPNHKQLCKRAPLGFHSATFSRGTETSMDVDISSLKANMFAEQGCASATLEELNAKEMHQCSESKPSKGTLKLPKSCISSSSQLPEEVLQRLNHLDNMVEQHSRSLALLSSQLEAQRQSLNSILEEFMHLKVDPACKVQCSPPPPHIKATLDMVGVSASGSTDQAAHPWPEWTHFTEHLRSLPFFKELVEVPEVARVSFADEPTIIKRMLAKFSQAYEYIFDALPIKHLQTLADYGCPNDDRRTVASYKRLKAHFQIENKSVSCGAGSSELASAKPRLLDVMRLLYVIAELAKKDGVSDNVKLSILHLLEELIKLTSTCEHGHIDRSEAFSNSRAVLQSSSREKSSSLKAKLGVQGSSSSTDAESLSSSDNWECPRCSYFNHEGKNECAKCNFQQPEKSDPSFDTVMPKSSFPAARTKVGVPGAEDKEPVLASVSGTLEQVLQTCILSEKEGKVLGGAGARDDSDADEHPDIFDDIFDQGDTRSSSVGPKCSLSDLIKQNKKAFSSTRKEREQGIADDHGRKGIVPSTDRGHRYDGNDANRRAAFPKVVQDDSLLESEDTHMRQSRGSGGRASFNPSLGIKQNHTYRLSGSVGKGLASQVHDDDRRRTTKSMQHYDSDGGLDAESETESFVSSRTFGNERSRANKSKHRGVRGVYSDSESGSRGGFERKKREGSSRSW